MESVWISLRERLGVGLCLRLAAASVDVREGVSVLSSLPPGLMKDAGPLAVGTVLRLLHVQCGCMCGLGTGAGSRHGARGGEELA